MKYCTTCGQNVRPVKSPWSWLAFACWIPTAGIGYIVYHLMLKPRNRCPICGLKTLERAKRAT